MNSINAPFLPQPPTSQNQPLTKMLWKLKYSVCLNFPNESIAEEDLLPEQKSLSESHESCKFIVHSIYVPGQQHDWSTTPFPWILWFRVRKFGQ